LKPITTFFLVSLFASFGAIAHPGGLDANGGHTDRATGVYHYHRGTNVPPSSPPIQSESAAPGSFEGKVEAKGIEMDDMATASQEPNAETGVKSTLSKLPWWVYLLGLGCGYLVWEVASQYYQKRKGNQ
jgi:hypothetical protein